MNKGITIPCPECKGILFRNGQFGNSGSFELKCPHCQQLVKVDINIAVKINTFPIKTVSIIALIFIITQLCVLSSLSEKVAQGINNALNAYVIETKN